MSWPTVPLGELATINPSTPKGLLGSDEEVAVVPMAAVSESGSMRVQEHRHAAGVSAGLSYFSSGDVLVAKITPCYENNKIAVADIDRPHAFGSTEFHVLRAAGPLHNRYLSHFLRQDKVREQGVRRMTGSGGQRRVPKAFLEALEIPLPPLDEQRRIAAMLDQADALRRKQGQSSLAVVRLERAIFLNMFGSPEANPRGFPMVDLGSLILEGPTNGLYRPAGDYGDGTPILRIGDFYDGKVVDLGALRRLRASPKELAAYGLKQGDVVINRVNSREYLGKSALIPPLSEATVFESNMMRMGLDLSAVEPAYCIAFLQLPFVKRQILRGSKDAINQSSINQGDVRALKIMLPPLSEQRAFLERLQAIERMREVQTDHSKHLDTLFASLQHRAFSGELSRSAERELETA